MNISLNWLKKFTDVPETISAQELAQLFTIRTAEVEGVINEGEIFHNIVIGEIISIQPHPNATKLRVTQTNVGAQHGGTLQIVCGAQNITEGQKVIVALPGSKVKWHGEGDYITLEKAELRGVESNGMICAGEEVGLEATPGGILDLSTYEPTKDYELKPGTPLSFLLNKNDVILEIDNKSLTHRPDCWGHYGIAREMSAIFGTKLKPYEKAVKLAKTTHGTSPLKIQIHDKDICPRFTACIVKNIKVKESPEWLKETLTKIGIRPVNNIVDVTNYVMVELGQPLHAYDRHTVATDMLDIRYAHADEQLETIDHRHHKLNKEDPIITNTKHPLTIAGVMGGAYSEISDSTTEIILESANWQPATVRKASQRHGLRTDAVQRFEKSLDPEMTLPAILRAIALIQKIYPKAELEGSIVDEYTHKNPTKIITIDPQKIQEKIGTAISTPDIITLLKRLQFNVKSLSGKPKKLEITVPSFRATKDINSEDDILEEVARLHGYEKIQPTLPSLPIKLPQENTQRKLEHQTRNVLSHKLGLSEVYNYSFYSKDELAACNLPEDLHLKLENYLSSEQTHLRISLIPNLLKNLQSNLRFTQEIGIYEIGRSYTEEHEFFPREEIIVTGALTSQTHESPFLAVKGIIDALASELSLTTQDWERGTAFAPTAHPNRYIELKTTEESLENQPGFARVYQLHPLVAQHYELPVTTAIFEVNLTHLLTQKQAEKIGEKRYAPIPKYPGIEIDIAVLIDKTIPAGTLQKAIHAANKNLIQHVNLFDHYEGQNIEPTKKSLAYRILLQSSERTLTEEDLNTTQKTITDAIQQLGGTIR